MSQASGRRRDSVLRGVAAALTRLDNGDYGLCLECGEPINDKRLAFDPTASLCIDCANQAES
jgi:DnaK suppressor protein